PAWCAKRSSGRCCACCRSTTKKTWSRRPTTAHTGWRPASGPPITGAPGGWRAGWKRAAYGSTPTSSFPSPRRSAASSRAASGARKACPACACTSNPRASTGVCKQAATITENIHMTDFKHAGFIGMGVMGEPICRNLAQKSGLPVLGYDSNPAPLQRLAAHGVAAAASLADVAARSDVLFLSLPSGEVVAEVARAALGLLASTRPGQVIVDPSTSPVDVTRALAAEFAARGAIFIDAPVARTRAAAEAGTLS